MDTREFVKKLSKTADRYNQKLSIAAKNGQNLYLPGFIDLAMFLDLLSEDANLVQEGDNSKEPTYLSLEEGLRGKNADGSLHGGFIIIDPNTQRVLRIQDREGNPSFDASDLEDVNAIYSGYVIEVETAKGRFELRTSIGVRGRVSVRVVTSCGNWVVLNDGVSVPVTSTRKVGE